MKPGSNFKISLPDHISVMNITAAVAVGALSVAAYLMVTEPFQKYDSVDAVADAEMQMMQPGDLPETVVEDSDFSNEGGENETPSEAQVAVAEKKLSVDS